MYQRTRLFSIAIPSQSIDRSLEYKITRISQEERVSVGLVSHFICLLALYTEELELHGYRVPPETPLFSLSLSHIKTGALVGL